MNPNENLTPYETPTHNKEEQPKSQKPFDPIEQKLEGCIELVNSEYVINFGRSLPDELKTPLSEAIAGKSQTERDEILDDIIYTIQTSDNPKNELMTYLEMIISKKIEDSNEQDKIQMSEAKTERNDTRYDLQNNAKLLKESVTKLDGTGKNYNAVLQKIQALQFDEEGNEEQDKKLQDEINTILSELQNPQTLFALSLDLKQKHPKAYEDFKASVIAIEPSFEAKFVAIEPKLMLALGSDILTNTTIAGNSQQF